MKVVIIGSGNVATHLAIALKESSNKIEQIYSRTLENAKVLADRVDAKPINNIEQLDKDADIYIISIKDDVILGIAQQMPQTNGIWVHTSGSVSIDVFLSNKSKGFGVFYPLQTFNKTREIDFAGIPVFIEGDSSGTLNTLRLLAESISQNIYTLDSNKRRSLHVAAVFANNFTNHMFTLASEILDKESISFDVIKPLIMETANKVMELNPADAQTGPAVRYDKKVMQEHLDLISNSSIKEIYSVLSKSIHNYSINSDYKGSDATKGDSQLSKC